MNNLTLLLAEDEAMVRQGIRAMLEKEGITKIYEAASGNEALVVLQQNPIDIVLLDIRMPGKSGIETLKEIKKALPKIPIIVVTGLEGTELILNLLKAGVNGFVQKMNGFEEILKALAAIKDGGRYFSEEVMGVIRNYSDHWDPPTIQFKDRELQLLKVIAEGLTSKEIADKFHMSVRTAETNRQRLLDKTRSLNTAGLIAYAYRNGII